jgi:hypothetical protein
MNYAAAAIASLFIFNRSRRTWKALWLTSVLPGGGFALRWVIRLTARLAEIEAAFLTINAQLNADPALGARVFDRFNTGLLAKLGLSKRARRAIATGPPNACSRPRVRNRRFDEFLVL